MASRLRTTPYEDDDDSEEDDDDSSEDDDDSSEDDDDDSEDDDNVYNYKIEQASITVPHEKPPSRGHQSNHQTYLKPQPNFQPKLNLQRRQQQSNLQLHPNFQLQPDFRPQPNFQPRRYSQHQSSVPSRPAVNSSPYVVQLRDDGSITRNHNIPPSGRRQSNCQPHLKTQPNLQPRQHPQHQPSVASRPAVNSAPRVEQFTVTTSRTCPLCDRETLKRTFTLKGWLYAIGCFPCGIICCLDMRKKKCSSCGYSRS